jgi:hypothetical protein
MASVFNGLQTHKRASVFLVAVGLCKSVGCRDGKIARYPVHGSVMVNNKPADGAMVIFCPLSGSEEVKKQRPFGITGPDGKFELTTLNKADGSPAGDYKILIQWPSNLNGDSRDTGARSLGPDRLKGRYMNLEKSQLTATIKEAPTDLPPFELKSQ